MLITVIAAAVGLFGDGWLSTAEARADLLTARYPRFARAHAPLELELQWTPAQQDTVLAIGRDYLDRVAVESILPTPAATTLDARGVYYTFQAREPQASVTVQLTLKPSSAGRAVAEIDVDGAKLTIRQFVFP